MSWRLSVDGPFQTADFVVGVDGDMAAAIEEYRWRAPVKVLFRRAAALETFLTAWDEAGGGIDDIWQIYRVNDDGTETTHLCGEHAGWPEVRGALSVWSLVQQEA